MLYREMVVVHEVAMVGTLSPVHTHMQVSP